MPKYKKGIVVLSGGQDSVTCLGVALKKCEEVYAVAFDYGQRHHVELECAKAVCDKHSVHLKVAKLDSLKEFSNSALIGNEGDVNAPHIHNKNLPGSYVPGRNAVFLQHAHMYAMQIGAEVVFAGVCQTDYSGYPDCREVFVRALFSALNVGYEANVKVRTPLMYLTKAETFELALYYDFLSDVCNLSHTCYEGKRETLHAWGYGCGECAACKLRKAGYEEFEANLTTSVHEGV